MVKLPTHIQAKLLQLVVIGAELHLEVKTVLWQETTTWQEESESVAGNGDVPPAPVSRARCSPFPAGFRVSRSQGSLLDQNLGCSTHQTMSPVVQPGLHKGVAQKYMSPSVGQTTVWLRVHSLGSKETPVRETQWWKFVTVHPIRVRKWMKLFQNKEVWITDPSSRRATLWHCGK